MADTRARAAIGAAAAAILGGGLLYVSAPATSLVDAPAYEVPQSVTDSIDTPITPNVSSFYDVDQWQPGPPGTLVKAEPISGAPGGTRLYRIMYQSTDLKGELHSRHRLVRRA